MRVLLLFIIPLIGISGGLAFATTVNMIPPYIINDTLANANRIVITSNGFVGIGNLIPGVQLDVVASTSQEIKDRVINLGTGNAAIIVNSHGGNPYIRLADLSTGKRFDIRQVAGSNQLQVFDFTAGAVRMVIDTSGNVGIGTTTPQAPLDVAGNIRLSGNITSSHDICIGSC